MTASVALKNQVFTYPKASQVAKNKTSRLEGIKRYKSLAGPIGSLVLWIGLCAYLLDKYAMGLVS